MRRSFLTMPTLIAALLLGGCATMQGDPLQVTVAGIESLPGEELEWRMLVKLRAQNPNDAPVDYDGVYIKLNALDKTLATGVADVRGSVPRFGETVIAVPVTVSMLRMALGAAGFFLNDSAPLERITYRLEGKLDGPGFGSTRFQAEGELPMPGQATKASGPQRP